MDTKFIPAEVEQKLYQVWEKSKFFEAKPNKDKTSFSIILPPPNANADLHLGHAMYVYEDIMIRFHKLIGEEVLWLPGADHAGIETQFVFEKHLQKEGKSRFDFGRDELYKMIWDFVMKNKGNMEHELKRLGFALDWSKEKFTLDPDIVKIVHRTFKKLFDDGLIYRAKRLVNYCTKCGTAFSDIEVKHIEQKDPLYYMKYGPFVLATVRPETKFGDTALAVHPEDKRYKKWIGKEIEVEGLIGKFCIKVVEDEIVDPEFGTGIIKVTPAHDMNDFEIGKRHHLEMRQVIGFDGKLTKLAGPYAGLRVKAARQKVVEDLKAKGLMDHVDENYTHTLGVCYRCSTVLEPLPLEQWYIKIRPLADNAKELIVKEKIKIYPKKFKKVLLQILDNFIDWNISRQIVWGIRIPAYRCQSTGEWFVSEETPQKCVCCGKDDMKQDEDTFDTWFSSAQWPFATLETIDQDIYDYYYPTSVMETGYDILRPWVARMIMVGYYATGKEPFQNIFLHGMVRDRKGQKMSKSKGNVINPVEMIDKYGADALRAALVFGTKEGNDTSLSEEKIIGMRNFANKVWNIGRFMFLNQKSVVLGPAALQPQNFPQPKLGAHSGAPWARVASPKTGRIITKLEKEFKKEKKDYSKYMNGYKFSYALGLIYEFLWHRFADFYIEQLKGDLKDGNIKALELLEEVYAKNLQMLYPFMPFVTETVWKAFKGEESSILSTQL